MSRRGAKQLGAATVAALIVVATLATGVGAATLDGHAWWWRGQTGVLAELPPPRTVPEDGLSVGRGPDDDTAWSAVRFRLVEGEVAPHLVLTVANDVGGSQAAIEACVASTRWNGGAAKRWDSRPPVDCSSAVAGAPSQDGATWSFPVEPLVADGGLVDVVLKPADGSTPFQLDFEAPSPESIQTSSADPGPEPIAVPPVTTGGPDSAPPPPVAQPIPAPPVPAAPAAPEPTATSDPAPQVAAPPATQPAPEAVPPAEPAAAPVRDLGRPMGLFVLALGLVTIVLLRRTDAPALARLGPLAATGSTPGPRGAATSAVGGVPGGDDPGGEVRGIGRFARPRTGRPTALR